MTSLQEENVNFIILYQGRAGSSFLVDALNRHPEVFADGEILAQFHPAEYPETDRFVDRIRAGLARFTRGGPAQLQHQYMRNLYDNDSRSARAVGFKTKVRDIIDLYSTKEILEERNVLAIVMRRQNLVKQTISRLSAHRLYATTGLWGLVDEADRPGPFEIGRNEFDRYFRQAVFDDCMLVAFADYLAVPKLNLEYARLLTNRDEWFESVFSFLDVEWMTLETRILQNTDDDLKKVVANFDELAGHYEGTEFEAMFYEQAVKHDS